MRSVLYSVAMNLDGFIAGPDGEYDWIPTDPSIDFEAFYGSVDTLLLGRKTYDFVREAGGGPGMSGTRSYVFSRTLDPADHPDVTLVSPDAESVVTDLRAEESEGDIWLFGGGETLRWQIGLMAGRPL